LAPKGLVPPVPIHLAAAFVAFFLLFKALFERFHELVPPHLFDGLAFSSSGSAPVPGSCAAIPAELGFGEVGDHLHALEVSRKGAVELVESASRP
jgi:hypothetical protein